jgi:hypothetical protein
VLRRSSSLQVARFPRDVLEDGDAPVIRSL